MRIDMTALTSTEGNDKFYAKIMARKEYYLAEPTREFAALMSAKTDQKNESCID